MAQQTAEFLLEQYRTYPASQPEDLMKALYQSVFGCGHLVNDPSAAAAYIRTEAENRPNRQPYTEPLDGDYTRVYLSVLQTGLSADTLARLLVLSVSEPHGDVSELESKLAVLTELVQQKKLPFSEQQTAEKLAAWRGAGYPACHHSDRYRDTYRPAYRLIHDRYIPWLPLFAAIDRILSQKGNVLAAIEGGSASGKTTLSKMLENVYDCNVFHMDDFFLQPHQRTKERLAEIGGNVDYERFDSEVLKPLCEEKPVSYRRFDCGSMTIQQPVTMPVKRINIVEGAYSMHPTLAEHYDLSLFLHIDPQLQKKRIEIRNTPFMQEKFFNIWIPMENRYFAHTDIESRCTLVMEVKE